MGYGRGHGGDRVGVSGFSEPLVSETVLMLVDCQAIGGPLRSRDRFIAHTDCDDLPQSAPCVANLLDCPILGAHRESSSGASGRGPRLAMGSLQQLSPVLLCGPVCGQI
jgi:hypothetical protein